MQQNRIKKVVKFKIYLTQRITLLIIFNFSNISYNPSLFVPFTIIPYFSKFVTLKDTTATQHDMFDALQSSVEDLLLYFELTLFIKFPSA